MLCPRAAGHRPEGHVALLCSPQRNRGRNLLTQEPDLEEPAIAQAVAGFLLNETAGEAV
jgi:hypothetical protein